MTVAELELQDEDGLAAAIAFERHQHALAFARTQVRTRRLKCLLDCGHWIDGSCLYRYQVWRVNGDPRGVIHQRTECETCARVDLRG